MLSTCCCESDKEPTQPLRQIYIAKAKITGHQNAGQPYQLANQNLANSINWLFKPGSALSIGSRHSLRRANARYKYVSSLHSFRGRATLLRNATCCNIGGMPRSAIETKDRRAKPVEDQWDGRVRQGGRRKGGKEARWKRARGGVAIAAGV